MQVEENRWFIPGVTRKLSTDAHETYHSVFRTAPPTLRPVFLPFFGHSKTWHERGFTPVYDVPVLVYGVFHHEGNVYAIYNYKQVIPKDGDHNAKRRAMFYAEHPWFEGKMPEDAAAVRAQWLSIE